MVPVKQLYIHQPAMLSLKALWTAVALALAQCCACSPAEICYDQLWLPEQPTTRRADALPMPQNRATGASPCTMKQLGQEAGSCNPRTWLLPAVCEKDHLAHIYAMHLGSAVTWYVLLGILLVPGAVAVAEQVLHSIWLTWVALVDEVPSDPKADIEKILVPCVQTQLRHVRNAWFVGLRPALGLDLQISRVLSAWFALVMAHQWFVEAPPQRRMWHDTFIDMWIPALLCVGPLVQPERSYLRTAAASALVQVHITPHHKQQVFTAFWTVVMGMPSVLSWSTIYYLTRFVLVVLMLCYVIGMELLGWLCSSCKFLSSGSNVWWLCRTMVWYIWVAIYWTVVAVIACVWLQCCAVYRHGKKFALWTASCVNSVFVFLGATELAAAAVISKHWSRIKPNLHLHYRQVRRIYRRTAGDPVAFTTQTVHWLVTGDIGTTNHSTAGQSPSGVSKRQQHIRQSVEMQHQQSPEPTGWRFWRSSSTGSQCATPTAGSDSTAAQALYCAVGSQPSNPSTAVHAAAEEDEELDLTDLLQWAHKKDSSKAKPTTTATGSSRSVQLRAHVSKVVQQHASGDLAVPVPALAAAGVPKPMTPKSKAKAATCAEVAKQQTSKAGGAGTKRPSKKQSTGLVQPPASTAQTQNAVDSFSKHDAAAPAQDVASSKQALSGKAAAQPSKIRSEAASPKQIKVLNAVVTVDNCTDSHSMRSSKVAEAQGPPAAAAEVVTPVLNPATAAADWPELQPVCTVAAAANKVNKSKKGASKAAAASSAKRATAAKQSKASRIHLTMETAADNAAAACIAAADVAEVAPDAASTESRTCAMDHIRPSTIPATSSVPGPTAANPQGAFALDRQQQYALDGASCVDSIHCQTPTISPQISGPYRPLMFSNSGSIASPRVSSVSSPAVSAAGSVLSQTGTAAAAWEDSPWSIPSAMADALGWPAGDGPAGWTAPWPAGPAASTPSGLGLGPLCALEHDSLAAATATAAANAVLEDSDDSSCVVCKLMPRTHACVHHDDEVCLCMCAGCSEVYNVKRGCPLCKQSVECMLVLK